MIKIASRVVMALLCILLLCQAPHLLLLTYYLLNGPLYFFNALVLCAWLVALASWPVTFGRAIEYIRYGDLQDEQFRDPSVLVSRFGSIPFLLIAVCLAVFPRRNGDAEVALFVGVLSIVILVLYIELIRFVALRANNALDQAHGQQLR